MYLAAFAILLAPSLRDVFVMMWCAKTINKRFIIVKQVIITRIFTFWNNSMFMSIEQAKIIIASRNVMNISIPKIFSMSFP